MLLQPDDDIYRARLVYLGPPGYTLPFQLPYAQYGLFVSIATVVIGGGFLLTHNVLGVGVEVSVSLILTSVIFDRADPDRPARKVIWMLLTDWRRTPTPKPDVELPTPSTSHIRVRRTNR